MTHKIRKIAFWCEVFYYAGMAALALLAASVIVLVLIFFLALIDGGV